MDKPVGVLGARESTKLKYLQFPNDPVEQEHCDVALSCPRENDAPVMKSRCKQCPGLVGMSKTAYIPTWVMLANCIRLGEPFYCHMSRKPCGELGNVCAEYDAARAIITNPLTLTDGETP